MRPEWLPFSDLEMYGYTFFSIKYMNPKVFRPDWMTDQFSVNGIENSCSILAKKCFFFYIHL